MMESLLHTDSVSVKYRAVSENKPCDANSRNETKNNSCSQKRQETIQSSVKLKHIFKILLIFVDGKSECEGRENSF